MLKSILLVTLAWLPLVASAAPGRVLEDAKTRKMERTQVQRSETERKLYDVEEVVEKHNLLKRTPEAHDEVSRRTMLTRPSKARTPLQREGDRP